LHFARYFRILSFASSRLAYALMQVHSPLPCCCGICLSSVQRFSWSSATPFKPHARILNQRVSLPRACPSGGGGHLACGSSRRHSLCLIRSTRRCDDALIPSGNHGIVWVLLEGGSCSKALSLRQRVRDEFAEARGLEIAGVDQL